MEKFTKGPWFREKGGRVLAQPEGFIPTPQHPVFVVANNVYLSAEGDEAIANSRLIAAAPELLAALKESVEFAQQELKEIGGCDHSVNICVCGVVRMVDAWNELITKAEDQ